jgi:2-polyprenyl-3-methyl-5-hydroxy-6-metoxy-1,4-benzoquinol methylase
LISAAQNRDNPSPLRFMAGGEFADAVDEDLQRMQDDVYRTMFEIEDHHWWYTAKQRIVLSLLDRYLTPHNGSKPRVADLGCGCGAMLVRLKDRYDAVGVDGSPRAIEFCAQRGIRAQLGQLGESLSLENGTFDAVLLLDVLEHLEHDRQTIEQGAALLKPGGIMICTVPAFQWLWSYWDTIHHHYRRYRRRQFGKLFANLGFKMELLTYANTALFPVAASVRTFQRLRKPSNQHTSMRIPPEPLNWTLRTIYAGERHVLGRLPMPFGLSIIGVARKTADEHESVTASDQ